MLAELTEEFREYAERGGQVFISMHSPAFLNASHLAAYVQEQLGHSSIRLTVDIYGRWLRTPGP